MRRLKAPSWRGHPTITGSHFGVFRRRCVMLSRLASALGLGGGAKEAARMACLANITAGAVASKPVISLLIALEGIVNWDWLGELEGFDGRVIEGDAQFYV